LFVLPLAIPNDVRIIESTALISVNCSPKEIKMIETTMHDDETMILVEFEPQPGVRQVSRFGDLTKEQIEKLAARSEYALDHAMGTIQAMAHRVTETVRAIKLSERPDEVAVEFGLKLDRKSVV